MHYHSKQQLETARGALYSFGSAVLLFFALALAQFVLCTPAHALGFEVRLDETDRSLVRFGYPPRITGLCISSDSIPLLANNLRYSQSVLVDYEGGFVSISERHGEYELYKPLFLTIPSYTSASNRLRFHQDWRSNLHSHFLGAGARSRGLFEWEIPVKFPKVVSKIIGEGGPGLKVTGYRRISFSGRSMWEDNVKNTATSRQSKFPSLHMEQQSSFKITGTIGSKISVQVDQDSRRTTDLENTLQLRYRGEEDEIIQTIEAGNTNLSVGSGVVGYGERKQGLFGIKTTAKIGGWDLTMITSQDKGSTQKADFKAGAETSAKAIRDYDYVKRTFYDLGYAGDFVAGDSITEIRLFKSNNTINSNTAQDPAPFGIAYVNLDSISNTYPEGAFHRRFQEIDPNEYFVQRNQHWIQFFSSLGEADILAAFYVVWNRQSLAYDTTGFLKDSCTSAEQETCMVLKLLKSDDPKPTDYTWDYEWKNVYFLGRKNMEREGFRLDIYKGLPLAENINEDPRNQDSTSYLRIFGLDQLDLDAGENPDGIVDYRQIDFGLGYLIFPNRHPFAPHPNISFTGNPGDTLKDKVEQIYSWTVKTEPAENSAYYMWVESASRESQYSLGHAPIIEGSETVTLNGRPLTRGEDYTIMYEIGQITFINPEALSPNADLTVNYEYAPLLMPEKKSVFGLMTEYNLGNNLKFGAVGIYKSEKTAEERPRVGQEPIKNFIWGSNLSFNAAPKFFTGMLNTIPWVHTEAPSSMTFRGDLAQSVPNPNTKNRAFIDDFEGSLEYTDLSIRRGVWTLSSPPAGYADSTRCRMYWYNPYDQVPVREIWPNKETERNEERTNVMHLDFFPRRAHRPSNQGFKDAPEESRWSGIMRSLYQGAWDQSRTKFLEIWVHGENGVLHVDLGEISEDLNGNKMLDTEDQPVNGQRDGILEPHEDTGLDGLGQKLKDHHDDSAEREFYGDSVHVDPSGDNFAYDKYNYYSDEGSINGTQGNRDDPDRGIRPDAEDINSNSILDLTNKYFEFAIDLSKSEFLAAETQTGWKLYRVPLKDRLNHTLMGDPDWGNIRFARLWVSSQDSCFVRIASIQLVGNRWQNLGISSLTNRQTPLPIGTPPNEEFEVFVKNTHEDPDYYPPPGIAGTLNRQTNVREKEQSLVFQFANLKAGHQGLAYRIFTKPEDYTTYRYLEMFVHGPEDAATENLEFFLRLGTDSTNFYEYRTPVSPGWAEDNKVLIDFDYMTGLKARWTGDSLKYVDGRLDHSEGRYRIRGSPALNRIRWFFMGVTNVDTAAYQPISGEVWADELTVTGIRKEKGIAASMDVSVKLADLASLSLFFKRQDSQFRSLSVNKESAQSTMSYRLNATGVQVHKFLPLYLGYSLPASFSYSRSLDLPKWKAGSDIVLPKDLREKEKRESISKSVSISPKFDHPTKNWLLASTLRRVTHSFTYSTSQSTSLQNPVQRSQSISMSGGYSFPLGKGLNLRPFGWMRSALLPRSFTQMSFSLLPTSVSVNGNLSDTRSHTENAVREVFDTYTRSFAGNLTASGSPIKAIPLNYSMRTTRDLKDPNTIIYSFNPRKAKLGIETSYSETFSAKYTPSWLSFLNANFSFDSKYDENADKLNSYNVGGTRTVRNSNDQRANFSWDWKKLLGGGKSKDEKKKASLLNPLNLLRKLTGRFDPINVSYRQNQTFSKSGLLARPALSYRLGFSESPGVERKGLAQSTDRETITEGYSAKSGITLLATHFDLSYGRNLNRTITASEDTKNTATRFPDFGFNLSKLGNLGIVKRFFTAFSCDVGYFRQVDERTDQKTGETLNRKTSENFSPLASLSMTWKNGIRTTLKITKKVLTDENLRRYAGNQSITKSYDNTINVTNSYSFSAPTGIKIPFLRRIRFKSTLGLSVGVSTSTGKTKSSVGGKPFNVTADNSRLSVSASASYNFSSQVTGGATAKWADTNDKKTKRKTHTRELGIWIQISF